MSATRERRRHLRLHQTFPVIVRGVDADGERFESQTVVNSFSAGGLSMRLERRLTLGARVFAVVRLSTAPTGTVSGPRVAVQGRVVRSEPRPDGAWGVAMAFTRHRFL